MNIYVSAALRSFATVIFMVVTLFLLASIFQSQNDKASSQVVSFSEFMDRVNEGKVAKVSIDDRKIIFHSMDSMNSFVASIPEGTNITDATDKLLAKKVQIFVQPKGIAARTSVILNLWGPILVQIFIFVFVIRLVRQSFIKK